MFSSKKNPHTQCILSNYRAHHIDIHTIIPPHKVLAKFCHLTNKKRGEKRKTTGANFSAFLFRKMKEKRKKNEKSEDKVIFVPNLVGRQGEGGGHYLLIWPNKFVSSNCCAQKRESV